MPNTDPIPMESLKLANDVLSRPATPDNSDAEARKLAQALIDANSALTVQQSKREMSQEGE